MLLFNFGWPPLVVLATGLLSTCLLRATAQHSSVICFSQYNWMDNSKNQNPCLVAAYAGAVCYGSGFNVPPLPSSTNWYGGPNADWIATPCGCSTVMYCLLGACSLCQNSASPGFWSVWSFNCSTVYVGYPESIPNATAIPQWAYQDVAPGGIFNLTLAEAVGDSPESIGATIIATTQSITSTSLTASLTSSLSLSASSTSLPNAQKSHNSSAIVGGAVGGAVGLASIAAVVIWLLCRGRRRHRVPPTALDG